MNGAPLSPSHGYAEPTLPTAQKLFSFKSGKFNKHFSLEVVVMDASCKCWFNTPVGLAI